MFWSAFLSLFLSVSITHCTCICTSLDPCFSLLFVSECVYKCRAKLSLIVFVYVRPLLISVCLTLFLCLSQHPALLSLIVRVLNRASLSLFLRMSVSMFGYIIALFYYFYYVYMYVSWFVFQSLFLYQYLYSLHVYVCVRWFMFVSLVSYECLYQCVRLYCHWLYVYRYVSWSAFVSLFFSLSVSVSWYIIGNSACIRTSLDSYFFFSLFLWMWVAVSDYIIIHTVGVYVRLLIRSSHPLFPWMFLSVFGYIVTDCTCIGTSHDPRFFLFFFSLSLFLSVCLSVRVYYR